MNSLATCMSASISYFRIHFVSIRFAGSHISDNLQSRSRQQWKIKSLQVIS